MTRQIDKKLACDEQSNPCWACLEDIGICGCVADCGALQCTGAWVAGISPCPPSSVADTIVPWANPDVSLNVAAGDLIVWCGEFSELAWVQVSDAPDDESRLAVFGLRGAGETHAHVAAASSQVAVRRYVEG